MNDDLIQNENLLVLQKDQDTQATEHWNAMAALTARMNWRLLGLAMEEQGIHQGVFEITIDDEHGDTAPFLSAIRFETAAKEEVQLDDEALIFLTQGRQDREDGIAVGMTVMDWPIMTALSIMAQSYLDDTCPGWNRPGSGTGRLTVSIKGDLIYFS